MATEKTKTGSVKSGRKVEYFPKLDREYNMVNDYCIRCGQWFPVEGHYRRKGGSLNKTGCCRECNEGVSGENKTN